MSFLSRIRVLSSCLRSLWNHPRKSVRRLTSNAEAIRGADVARGWGHSASSNFDCGYSGAGVPPSPLREYFDAIDEGAGVWKWLHYFDIYHRHLQKFVGRKVTIVEVG